MQQQVVPNSVVFMIYLLHMQLEWQIGAPYDATVHNFKQVFKLQCHHVNSRR